MKFVKIDLTELVKLNKRVKKVPNHTGGGQAKNLPDRKTKFRNVCDKYKNLTKRL